MPTPNALRAFQLAFGQYLRHPEAHPLPQGIEPRRARAYEELLFKNISGFINSCFPVARSLLDDSMWQTMLRHFFAEHRAQSPLFKDIPAEFLQYFKTLHEENRLPEKVKLPVWFFDLAHYEWVELAIDTAPDIAPPHVPHKLQLTQPLALLAYEWPVHQVSSDFQPESPRTTHLVVWRDKAHDVQFIEATPATFLLLHLLEEKPLTAADLFARLAQALNREFNVQFIGFCNQIVDELKKQAVIV